MRVLTGRDVVPEVYNINPALVLLHSANDTGAEGLPPSSRFPTVVRISRDDTSFDTTSFALLWNLEDDTSNVD